MITEPEYKGRIEALVAAGVDEREAPVRVILEYGTEAGRITEAEKDVAITTFQSFLSAHPGFSFLSPRERYRTSSKNGEKYRRGEKESEDELWSTIQPILDRAQ